MGKSSVIKKSLDNTPQEESDIKEVDTDTLDAPQEKPVEKTEEEKKQQDAEFEKKIKDKDTAHGVNLDLLDGDMNDSFTSPASSDDAIIKRVVAGDVKMKIYDRLEKIAHEIYKHDKKLAKEVDSVTDILQKYI